jgi:hypothetical protein
LRAASTAAKAAARHTVATPIFLALKQRENGDHAIAPPACATRHILDVMGITAIARRAQTERIFYRTCEALHNHLQ